MNRRQRRNRERHRRAVRACLLPKDGWLIVSGGRIFSTGVALRLLPRWLRRTAMLRPWPPRAAAAYLRWTASAEGREADRRARVTEDLADLRSEGWVFTAREIRCATCGGAGIIRAGQCACHVVAPCAACEAASECPDCAGYGRPIVT